MGIEFREGSLVIGPNCDLKAKKGMVFNVNVGVTGIKEKSAKDGKSREWHSSLETLLRSERESPLTY